jgi:hypothetical protein
LLTEPGNRARLHRGNYKNRIKQPQNQEKPDKYERRKEVRKIFSIILALGLILGLVVIAAPVSAHIVCVEGDVAVVDVSPACACSDAAYNITWNITASLTQGVGCVCVEFPAGTIVPAEFDDEVIIIGKADGTLNCTVFGDEVTVTTTSNGTKVCFIPPCTIEPGEILVQFTEDAGIENPCVAGDYVLKVWTCRAPDSTPVEGEYTIIPEYTTFRFQFNFGTTYPGIAPGFVPPFRACGQNDTDAQGLPKQYDTTYVAGWGFVTNFTLTFKPASKKTGCLPPCETADLFLEVVNIPDQEHMHLVLNGTAYDLTICNITKNVGKYDASTDILLANDYVLANNTTITWNSSLHFSSPSKDYKIGLYYDCPKTTCSPGGVVGATQVFKVYQDKEAYKLTLCEKWNLVSLPLVPLVDPPTVEEYLASISMPALGSLAAYGQYMIQAIWYYDAFATPPTDPWKHWAPGDPANTLLTLEDGKAYWVYVAYPLAEAMYEFLYEKPGSLGTPCCGSLVWWTWGTEKPVPPAAPSTYSVNKGWNMVGFTSLNMTMTPKNYLWNWVSPYSVPVTYGYSDNCWNLQTWQLIPWDAGTYLKPGEGYFVAFPSAGSIFVP